MRRVGLQSAQGPIFGVIGPWHTQATGECTSTGSFRLDVEEYK